MLLYMNTDEHGMTPLDHAVLLGQLNIVKFYVEHLICPLDNYTIYTNFLLHLHNNAFSLVYYTLYSYCFFFLFLWCQVISVS